MSSVSASKIYPSFLEGDEIRLLQVRHVYENRQEGEPKLDCYLHHEKFDPTCPDYTAFSYTWGSPIDGPGRELFEGDSNVINISLLTHLGIRSVVPIGRNLYDALRAFHHRSGSDAFIWADALSINQENLHEKAIHVSAMDRIYARAKQVEVWAGEPDPDSTYEDVITLTTEFHDLLPTDDFDEIHKAKCELVMESATAARLEGRGPLITTKHLNSLPLFFMQRKFFHRIWIFQELLLSPEVYIVIRSARIRPKCFILILKYMMHLISNHHQLFDLPEVNIQRWYHTRVRCWYYLNHLGRGIGEYTNKPYNSDYGKVPPEQQGHIEKYWSTLFKFTEDTKNLSASNPLDHIYSLLGLMRMIYPEAGPLAIVPDYTKSQEEVFRFVTTQLFQNLDLSIFMAAFTDVSLRESKGLPSWVIDFPTLGLLNFNTIGTWTSWKLPVTRSYERTDMKDKSDAEIQIDGSKLQLKGNRCDKLKTIYHWMGKPLPSGIETVLGVDEELNQMTPPDMLHRLRVMLEIYSSLNPKFNPTYVNGEPAIQVLLNLIDPDNLEWNNKSLNEDKVGSFLASVTEDLVARIAESNSQINTMAPSNMTTAQQNAGRILELLEELDGSGGLPTAAKIRETAHSRNTAPLEPPRAAEMNLAKIEFPYQRPDRYIHVMELFITEHGFVGRGLPSIREGDEVWMLPVLGGAPAILRPTERDGEYKLINRTYVRGGNYDGYFKHGYAEPMRSIALV